MLIALFGLPTYAPQRNAKWKRRNVPQQNSYRKRMAFVLGGFLRLLVTLFLIGHHDDE